MSHSRLPRNHSCTCAPAPASAPAPAPAPAPPAPPIVLNVLVACEESQTITAAFRALGHNAFSCDLQPCRPGGHPEWHIQSDATSYLQGQTGFVTLSGDLVLLSRWHLIIAHPPCTYLCKIGSPHLYRPDGTLEWSRLRLMLLARRFFFLCLDARAPYVAVENPIPMKRAQLPPPSCYIHPSWYGVKYTKKTLFWLRNLPPLLPTVEHPHPRCYVTSSRGKYRSRTFPQVAAAIAEQWSAFIVNDLQQHPDKLR